MAWLVDRFNNAFAPHLLYALLVSSRSTLEESTRLLAIRGLIGRQLGVKLVENCRPTPVVLVLLVLLVVTIVLLLFINDSGLSDRLLRAGPSRRHLSFLFHGASSSHLRHVDDLVGDVLCPSTTANAQNLIPAILLTDGGAWALLLQSSKWLAHIYLINLFPDLLGAQRLRLKQLELKLEPFLELLVPSSILRRQKPLRLHPVREAKILRNRIFTRSADHRCPPCLP